MRVWLGVCGRHKNASFGCEQGATDGPGNTTVALGARLDVLKTVERQADSSLVQEQDPKVSTYFMTLGR
jgi:hypothetical protein